MAFIAFLLFSRRHFLKSIVNLTRPITLLPIISIPVNFWEIRLLTLKAGAYSTLACTVEVWIEFVCQQRSSHSFILSAK